MSTANLGMLIAMLLYLAGMLVIGFKTLDRTGSAGDFYLGGRKLGPFVTAMSAEASDMSSWLLMGLPGLAYLSGVADPAWTAIGLAVGTYLNWRIVAKRIRLYSEINNSITIPEFFSKRYGDKNKMLTLVAAIWIVVFFIPYAGSGFAACGKLFSNIFDMDYHTAMIGSAFVIIGYTSLGGFLAASTTDMIQSVVMSLALCIVLCYGTIRAGGLGAVMENVQALPGYFSMMASYDPVHKTEVSYHALSVISTLAWGLGYFGMPHILLRFMAIEDHEKLNLSRRIASVWVVISMAIAIVIGMVGLGMTKAGVIPSLDGSNSETVIILISSTLAGHGLLPAFIGGIVLSGILASTMSTADSQLLAASSSVTNDILTNVFHIRFSDKKLMYIARASLFIIAFISIIIAWNPDSYVFKIVSFAWAGFGASFGPVTILALFWRRSNKEGALAGMITGGIIVFVWKYIVRPMGGYWDIYELLPAFIIAILVNVFVSLVTKAPDESVTNEFDQVENQLKRI